MAQRKKTHPIPPGSSIIHHTSSEAKQESQQNRGLALGIRTILWAHVFQEASPVVPETANSIEGNSDIKIREVQEKLAQMPRNFIRISIAYTLGYISKDYFHALRDYIAGDDTLTGEQKTRRQHNKATLWSKIKGDLGNAEHCAQGFVQSLNTLINNNNIYIQTDDSKLAFKLGDKVFSLRDVFDARPVNTFVHAAVDSAHARLLMDHKTEALKGQIRDTLQGIDFAPLITDLPDDAAIHAYVKDHQLLDKPFPGANAQEYYMAGCVEFLWQAAQQLGVAFEDLEILSTSRVAYIQLDGTVYHQDSRELTYQFIGFDEDKRQQAQGVDDLVYFPNKGGFVPYATLINLPVAATRAMDIESLSAREMFLRERIAQRDVDLSQDLSDLALPINNQGLCVAVILPHRSKDDYSADLQTIISAGLKQSGHTAVFYDAADILQPGLDFDQVMEQHGLYIVVDPQVVYKSSTINETHKAAHQKILTALCVNREIEPGDRYQQMILLQPAANDGTASDRFARFVHAAVRDGYVKNDPYSHYLYPVSVGSDFSAAILEQTVQKVLDHKATVRLQGRMDQPVTDGLAAAGVSDNHTLLSQTRQKSCAFTSPISRRTAMENTFAVLPIAMFGTATNFRLHELKELQEFLNVLVETAAEEYGLAPLLIHGGGFGGAMGIFSDVTGYCYTDPLQKTGKLIIPSLASTTQALAVMEADGIGRGWNNYYDSHILTRTDRLWEPAHNSLMISPMSGGGLGTYLEALEAHNAVVLSKMPQGIGVAHHLHTALKRRDIPVYDVNGDYHVAARVAIEAVLAVAGVNGQRGLAKPAVNPFIQEDVNRIGCALLESGHGLQHYTLQELRDELGAMPVENMPGLLNTAHNPQEQAMRLAMFNPGLQKYIGKGG